MKHFNKTRGLLLFSLFLIFAISGPLALADAYQVELMEQQNNVPQERSAKVYIRFKDLNMNFRNRDNIRQKNSILGAGSVVQIPTNIAKFNQDGSINLNRTMEYWLEYARHQEQYLSNPHYNARSWNCGARGQSQCDGVSDGELFFPVKVVKSSDESLNIHGRNAYGYLALDFLRNNVHPSRYETVHTTLENALQFGDHSNLSDTVVAGGDSSYQGPSGDSETTSGIGSVPRPEERPENIGGIGENVFNCYNTLYRSRNYANHSCLKDKSLKERAELVMKDVAAINKERTGFNLDPRFSACIAYRESKMHPNAKGGTPDWGMYQVIDSTGAEVLRRNDPVTPGFSQFRFNWNKYRDNMLKSTLAQADLHHSVLFEKAKASGKIGEINRGTTSTAVYRTLATRYNGSGSRARRYGRAIANCYEAMKSVATRAGTVTNSSGLQAALHKAAH